MGIDVGGIDVGLEENVGITVGDMDMMGSVVAVGLASGVNACSVLATIVSTWFGTAVGVLALPQASVTTKSEIAAKTDIVFDFKIVLILYSPFHKQHLQSAA